MLASHRHQESDPSRLKDLVSGWSESDIPKARQLINRALAAVKRTRALGSTDPLVLLQDDAALEYTPDSALEAIGDSNLLAISDQDALQGSREATPKTENQPPASTDAIGSRMHTDLKLDDESNVGKYLSRIHLAMKTKLLKSPADEVK